MFQNMIVYMADNSDHILHPEIVRPILWGDYESENGLLTGIYSGMMLNTYPVLTGRYRNKEIRIAEEGHIFAEKPGGWNNRAGIQYVPYGRRPFGPYRHRGFGGIPEPDFNDSNTGKGSVWLTIPPGRKSMVNKIWNPSDQDILFEVFEDNKTIGRHTIPAGKLKELTDPINSTGTVQIEFRTDRRLVLLETFFK